MTASKQSVAIAGREVALSNPDKILYPETGFTKGEAIGYYLKVAPTILPHLKGRPLTLKRYPNGVEQPFFYEKRCPKHKPSWIKTINVFSESTSAELAYCTLDTPAALAWVANLASLELHILLAKAPKVDQPTAIAFDFDPGPPAGILEACEALLMVHNILEHLGLQAFPKTSGGKGMHLYVPLNTAINYDRTKEFARTLARMLERDHPGQITSNPLKTNRRGKIFMDWSQNDFHKTTVCVYSLRARSRPTVSMPVTWEEIEKAVAKKSHDLLTFEVPAALKRTERLGDLFAPVLKLKQRLPK